MPVGVTKSSLEMLKSAQLEISSHRYRDVLESSVAGRDGNPDGRPAKFVQQVEQSRSCSSVPSEFRGLIAWSDK